VRLNVYGDAVKRVAGARKIRDFCERTGREKLTIRRPREMPPEQGETQNGQMGTSSKMAPK